MSTAATGTQAPDHWRVMSAEYREGGRRVTDAQDEAGAALYPAWFEHGLGSVWTLLRTVGLLDEATALAVAAWPADLVEEYVRACRRPEHGTIRARATLLQLMSGGAPLTLSTAWRMREWPTGA